MPGLVLQIGLKFSIQMADKNDMIIIWYILAFIVTLPIAGFLFGLWRLLGIASVIGKHEVWAAQQVVKLQAIMNANKTPNIDVLTKTRALSQSKRTEFVNCISEYQLTELTQNPLFG